MTNNDSNKAMADTPTTVDVDEIARFASWAEEWWNPNGKFKPLHKFHPERMAVIVERLCAKFDRDALSDQPLAGLSVLDIGCGGGLVAEPLCRLGASVTGIDAAKANIEAAKIHAEAEGLSIEYRAETAENLVSVGAQFDAVLALEVIEHVREPGLFIKLCHTLCQNDGYVLFSTINRTFKAFVLAIVGAEYVLRWLPKGTHTYDKFVTPDEISKALISHGCDVETPIGLTYNPFSDRWSRTSDTDVNYFLGGRKRKAQN